MNTLAIRCLVPVLPALLAACATAPKPLQGQFTVVEPNQIAAQGRVGDYVRWGGILIETQPQSGRTCLEILGRELSDTARPRERDDASLGRFIACRDGFYDPEVFTHGREVTVTGTVARLTERTVGDYVYVMPEVAADVVYLWPERRYYDHPPVTVGVWGGPWMYHQQLWFGTYYRYPPPRPRPRPRPAPR